MTRGVRLARAARVQFPTTVAEKLLQGTLKILTIIIMFLTNILLFSRGRKRAHTEDEEEEDDKTRTKQGTPKRKKRGEGRPQAV